MVSVSFVVFMPPSLISVSIFNLITATEVWIAGVSNQTEVSELNEIEIKEINGGNENGNMITVQEMVWWLKSISELNKSIQPINSMSWIELDWMID